ncbi:hypothetical protein [Vibrio paucivorans]
MFQVNTQQHNYSKANILAQPTYPMNIDESVLGRLARLSGSQQWILFTSECPRPDLSQFASYNVSCNKIIQMKPSQTMSEVEIVIKAIKSGNASAVVASTSIDLVNQSLLQDLALEHHCEVFFVEGRGKQYH